MVDDEPDMIWAIKNVLMAEGHSVISVNSGAEALEKVSNTSLDLVLLDFRLPEMDGIQILERIRQIQPNLPVIMLTGYGGIEEAVQAIKLGASHYLSKPFDNTQLIESVNKALQMNVLKSGGVFGKRLAEKIEKPKSFNSPVPLKQRKTILPDFWPKAVGVALLLFFLGGGFYLWKSKGRSPNREFAISHSKVSGLAFSGSSLWVTDWFIEKIERYDLKGNQLSLTHSTHFPGVHLTGIAAGPDFIFTCDSWGKRILKHALDDGLTIVKSYPSPGPEPSGLFFDGKYLWSCDSKTRKIYHHALDETLTVLEVYDTSAEFPIGLFHDGKNLWTASAVGTRIYKSYLSKRSNLSRAYIFKDSPDHKVISAFTMKDGFFWIAYEDVGAIFLKNPSYLEEAAL